MTRTLLFFPLLLGALALAPAGSEGARCEGPTSKVQVTVKETAKQGAEGASTYLFTVKNLHKSPIAIIGLGEGDRDEMQSIPDNMPKAIVTPEGWEGGTAFKDESKFMQAYWKTQEPALMIASGQSLDGFKLEMPPPRKGPPLFHLDGTLSRPLEMKKAPFRIYFEDGTCAWGRVTEEK